MVTLLSIKVWRGQFTACVKYVIIEVRQGVGVVFNTTTKHQVLIKINVHDFSTDG